MRIKVCSKKMIVDVLNAGGCVQWDSGCAKGYLYDSYNDSRKRLGSIRFNTYMNLEKIIKTKQITIKDCFGYQKVTILDGR